MSGSVFVGDCMLLDVSFDATRRRLGCLAGDGVLLAAAEYAYGAGITGLAAAAGPAAGASRLAGVRPGHLTETGDCALLGLRWEAIGADGALFPALDAGLALSPAGENETVLTLAGACRLASPAGPGPGLAIVRCFAAVTIRSFLARLACVLMDPAGAALPAGRARSGTPMP